METDNIPLNKVAAGNTVRIVRIDAGKGLKNRLAALGLLTGSRLTVVRSLGGGQLVVEIFNSKTLLGRGITEKIYVAP
jgi:ferrous iron transport protein A